MNGILHQMAAAAVGDDLAVVEVVEVVAGNENPLVEVAMPDHLLMYQDVEIVKEVRVRCISSFCCFVFEALRDQGMIRNGKVLLFVVEVVRNQSRMGGKEVADPVSEYHSLEHDVAQQQIVNEEGFEGHRSVVAVFVVSGIET